jgi:hypothetical protein
MRRGLLERGVEHHSGGLSVRLLSTAACILFLAACNKGPAPGEPNGPVAGAPGGPIATGRADTSNAVSGGEATAVQAGALPPPGPIPRFVGKWATNQKSCDSAAWQFTQTTLRTPAGSSCSFGQVTQVPGGYDVKATCTAEGPPAADTLQIRFAESAKAMLFASRSIADTGLVFCGRDV